MKKDRAVTLHFLDGSKISFAFPKQTDMAAARQVKLDSLWESNQLIVETEGEILVFPISSIKYIQLSMTQAPIDQIKLPAHTIRGAVILD